MVFCNRLSLLVTSHLNIVTILILIDGFLQYRQEKISKEDKISHNPYFNRWFSAIKSKNHDNLFIRCHNPYFNRWFSAISLNNPETTIFKGSQSLF